MARSIQAKLLIGFLAALAVLAVVGTLIVRTMLRLERESIGVMHEFRVLQTLRDTARPIGEVSYALQRFETSHHPEDIAEAPADAARSLHRCRDAQILMADHPNQIGLLHQLERELTTLIQILDAQGVLARKPEGVGPAEIEQSIATAEQSLSSIWLLLRNIESTQHTEVSRQLNALRQSDRAAWIAYLALVLLCLMMLGTIYVLVRRDLAARARVETELRQSRERFELAVRGSNDGIWDWDVTTDLVYFSPRWKSMLGYNNDEIKNHFDEWASRLHPEDRQRALAAVAAYHSGETAEYVLEHRLRHKDGSYRWILARGVALRDGAGRPYRMAGSHTDVTQRKEAESQLAAQNLLLEQVAEAERQANETLRRAQVRMIQSEKLAGLGQLVAGVAHEINNPLAFVTNNIAVLKRDIGSLRDLIELYHRADPLIARDDVTLHRDLRELEDRADVPYTLDTLPELMTRTLEGLSRIRRIVNDLRLFARLDEGEMYETDLNAGIESTATIIRGTARDRGITLTLDLHPLPPIQGNATRINQVILNLISNAIDATHRGGTVTVATSADPDGQGVRFQVSDTGDGVDPEIRDRIFDPFFTTKPVGQGTGLGLSISYGIVQEHGGTIELESEPGHGSTFTVWLPPQPPSPPALAASTPTAALPAPEASPTKPAP